MTSAAIKRGLSPDAYTSTDVFAAECERIFAKAWCHVAYVHDIPLSGDLMPIHVFGLPIVLVHDHGGTIRAYHNVCRHRGTILVPERISGRAVINCRYHGWTYGLTGELRRTPYFGGGREEAAAGFDALDHGLVPVRCVRWHGWIFVNLDGEAPPFDDYVGPLARRLAHVPLERSRPLATLELGLVSANWKLIMENSLENYHVPFVHPTTAVQPLEDHFDVIDDTCLGTGVTVKGGGQHRQVADAPTALDMTALYLGLWPSFILAAYEPATIVTHLNLPLGPGVTLRRVALFSTAETLPSENAIRSWRALSGKVAEEDLAVFEAQQRGRASPGARDGGILSPRWEAVVAAFQERVSKALS